MKVSNYNGVSLPGQCPVKLASVDVTEDGKTSTVKVYRWNGGSGRWTKGTPSNRTEDRFINVGEPFYHREIEGLANAEWEEGRRRDRESPEYKQRELEAAIAEEKKAKRYLP